MAMARSASNSRTRTDLSTLVRTGICVLGIALVAAGCGSSGNSESPPEPGIEQPKAESAAPLKSSEIVRLCADLTGQEIFSTGRPVAGFVPCLRRLKAPPEVIEAWLSG